MLKQRVTVEEAIARMAPFDRPHKPKKRRHATPSPPGEGANARAIRELAVGMLPGDELWEYDSGGDSWRHLHGEMGFAVVRAGRVVAFNMHLNN